LDVLPGEHHFMILEFLSVVDLCHVSLLSKAWYQAATDPSHWRQAALALWGDKQIYSQLITSNCRSHWKRRYYDSIRDSKRDILSLSELMETRWAFQFHSDMGFPPGTTVATFSKSVRHNPMLGSDLPWRFVDRKSSTGVLTRVIQIANYPPYSASRTPDWGWMFISEYAVYRSLPQGAELPPELPDIPV